jgi:galactonate dehydratase
MKITGVKSFPVRRGMLVKIETDDGYYGWGEVGPSAWGRELAAEGMVTHFRQMLIGKDPMDIGALWQVMFRKGSGFDGGRVEMAAISAIDIALHDLVARSLGVPVYHLLGGKHRYFVPCFTPIMNPDAPNAVEDTKRMLDEGWSVLRLSMGGHEEKGIFEPRRSLAVTADGLVKLREAVGPEPVLGIDYHAMLNVAEAASFCQRLPAGTLDFIEDPIHERTPAGYRALRRMTEVPFAVGEAFTSKWDWLPYIEEDLVNLARIDVANVGGFTEAMKVAALCEAHYIEMMPHLAISPIQTATIIHFAAAVPNFAWMEDRHRDSRALVEGKRSSYRPPDSNMYPVHLEPDGVRWPVPTGPGLGVEVNEEMLEATYEPSPETPTRRRDGSLTI